MNRALLDQVRRLADDRCDYCRIPSGTVPSWWDELAARATIRVLAINDPDAVAFRAELMDEGAFF